MAVVPKGLPPLPPDMPQASGRNVRFGLAPRQQPLPRAEAGFDHNFSPPIRNDWDDRSSIDLASSASSEMAGEVSVRPITPLKVKRAPSGSIMELSLSARGEEMLFERQQGLAGSSMGATLQPTLSIAFSGTLSAQGAVHGTSLKWTKGDNIGRGSLGTVFQAMDQRSGQVFAVKEVLINPDDDEDLQFRAALENEVSIVKDLKHPRIVSYLGHDQMDSCLYIYLEFMPGGSLSQVLQQFGALEESLIAVYTRELLEGLEYLHTRDPPVVHRDIKGANVLVGLDCRVKLSDFGCSKRTVDTMSCTMRGSIPWMAPEVICHTGYGRRADIWSFGCVIIEMATAKSPWGGFDNPMAAMHKIGMSNQIPAIPEMLTDTCQDFIKSCLQRDAALRPTASELLDHDLVRDLITTDF